MPFTSSIKHGMRGFHSSEMRLLLSVVSVDHPPLSQQVCSSGRMSSQSYLPMKEGENPIKQFPANCQATGVASAAFGCSQQTSLELHTLRCFKSIQEAVCSGPPRQEPPG